MKGNQYTPHLPSEKYATVPEGLSVEAAEMQWERQEIRDLLERASYYLEIPEPALRFQQMRYGAIAGRFYRREYNIALWDRHPVTLLHEVSHAAANVYHRNPEAHGTEFGEYFTDVLHEYWQELQSKFEGAIAPTTEMTRRTAKQEIIALAVLNMTASQISESLGVRYQHAYNVMKKEAHVIAFHKERNARGG